MHELQLLMHFSVEIYIIGNRSARVPTLVCTCGEECFYLHFVGVVLGKGETGV